MMPMPQIVRYDRPDMRAEAAAMHIMADAFDPRFGEAWTAQQLSSFTSLAGVVLTIAQLDGASLGFTLTRSVADETELLLLAVARQWQGKGIGKLLVKQCMGDARRASIHSIHLEVRANNPAIYFYDSLGFENVYRRPAYYKASDGSTYDALSYRIDI